MSLSTSDNTSKEVGNWVGTVQLKYSQVLEGVIGKGAQATVYRGRNTKDNRVAAIKEFHLGTVNDKTIKQIQVSVWSGKSNDRRKRNV